MRLLASLLAASVAVSLVIAGCSGAPSSAAPSATVAPTAAPAAPPTKAAEPTKPAPALPSPTTAQKVVYPVKGKAITVVAPFAAGGNTDVGARLLAAGLEKELGTPVQVVNKVGAGSQVGLTEIATSKPDGYTLGVMPLPSGIGVYLDPERKAVFNRASFQPIAQTLLDPIAIAVKADAPYKTLKDLADAAKAKPGALKAACGGILSVLHMTVLQTEKATGGSFSSVHFESGAQGITALLGGHVDVSFNVGAELQAHNKSGAVRILGIADSQESRFYPGVPTLDSQGVKVTMATVNGLVAPAGLPKDMTDILSAASKKAMDGPEMKTKMAELGMEPRYLDAGQFAASWDALEAEVKPLIEETNKKK